MILEFFRQ